MQTSERISYILLAIIMLVALMFFSINIGRNLAMQNKIVLTQYSGIGVGVLQNGTVLDLGKEKQYSQPDQIIGKINKPGIWKVQE